MVNYTGAAESSCLDNLNTRVITRMVLLLNVIRRPCKSPPILAQSGAWSIHSPCETVTFRSAGDAGRDRRGKRGTRQCSTAQGLLSPVGRFSAAVGIFTGVLAKEAVVGSLNALYSQVAASVPEQLGKLSDKALDPLGLAVGEVEDMEAAAQAQEVSVGAFGAMSKLFGSSAAGSRAFIGAVHGGLEHGLRLQRGGALPPVPHLCGASAGFAALGRGDSGGDDIDPGCNGAA
jgi:hypothetical protein